MKVHEGYLAATIWVFGLKASAELLRFARNDRMDPESSPCMIPSHKIVCIFPSIPSFPY